MFPSWSISHPTLSRNVEVTLTRAERQTDAATASRRVRWLGPIAIVALVASACTLVSAARPSVWVDNRSSQAAAFFLDDLSTGPGGWFIVPAHTTAHAGSDGLGSTDVRVNVLGWGHEAGHVSECSPGNYDDTLYDVPGGHRCACSSRRPASRQSP
jgi:hypothetical protein